MAEFPQKWQKKFLEVAKGFWRLKNTMTALSKLAKNSFNTYGKRYIEVMPERNAKCEIFLQYMGVTLLPWETIVRSSLNKI